MKQFCGSVRIICGRIPPFQTVDSRRPLAWTYARNWTKRGCNPPRGHGSHFSDRSCRRRAPALPDRRAADQLDGKSGHFRLVGRERKRHLQQSFVQSDRRRRSADAPGLCEHRQRRKTAAARPQRARLSGRFRFGACKSIRDRSVRRQSIFLSRLTKFLSQLTKRGAAKLK